MKDFVNFNLGVRFFAVTGVALGETAVTLTRPIVFGPGFPSSAPPRPQTGSAQGFAHGLKCKAASNCKSFDCVTLVGIGFNPRLSACGYGWGASGVVRSKIGRGRDSRTRPVVL